MNPNSLFSLSDHLEQLSKDGDPLKVLNATVDFEYFRGRLVEGLDYRIAGWQTFLPFRGQLRIGAKSCALMSVFCSPGTIKLSFW